MALSVTTFVTLDGVMQGPGGPDEDPNGGFTLGGWVFPLFDDALGAFIDATFRQADAFLLGRRTYEVFAAHWPKAADQDDPVARALNTLPKHVVSRTLKTVSWNNSTLVQGDVVKAIGQLKESTRALQVHGSAGLVQTLLARRLVDELNLLTFPVVLGAGKRLFGPGAVPAKLELVEEQRSPTGVLMARYRVTGEPSFATVSG